MEQTENADALLQRGFNDGYLLARYEPELAAKLTAQTHGQNPYMQGLQSGKEQYEMELRTWAKGLSRDSLKHDERERDIGDER